MAACSIDTIAQLPVTMSGLQPLVPAKINGVERMFVADSGAFYSMIEPSAAAELKLPLTPMPFEFSLVGVGGSAVARVTTVKVFTLSGQPIKNIQFLVASGSSSAAGLLGQNVLGYADVEYDLSGGFIRLMKPHNCGNANLAYWDKGGNFSFIDIHTPERNNPHTTGEAYVNGVKIRVMFDTGAGNSVLTRAGAARLGITPDSPGVTYVGSSAGIGSRSVRSWIAPIASFKIGDEEIRSTRLVVGDFSSVISMDTDMLLGADFFLSHRVFVANSQNKLFFTYNGGPVFNLTTTKAYVQEGPDQPLKESTPAIESVNEPTDAEGFSRRGEVFVTRRDYDHAIADFTRAMALDPTQAKYAYERATARLQNKQPILAMADLDKTLELQPDNLEALAMRARLRLAERDKLGATADIDQAAKLAPKESDLRLRLAYLYQGADKPDAALAQFDLWIGAHPEDGRLGEALNGRCWTRATANIDLDKALNDCDRAVRSRVC
jgi:predicted aspartyl protease/Tfp pilus assembly protein PilF